MSQDLEATDALLSPLAQRETAPGLPERFGAYEIERLLGTGAMGHVYLGRDTRLHRHVAIKVLNPHAWGESGEGGRQRLVREALALAKLSHPNILTVFEIGSVGDELFVATEFVEGGTLREWLAAGPRSQRAVLTVFAQAGRGLAAAHRAGLIHRDFKPDNVLVDGEGRVRVSDFGLVAGIGIDGADAPAEGALGTPAYMSPEQHDGRAADARSDQYSFCATLFEVLGGARPFTGTLDELARQKRAGPPSSMKIPVRLRATLARGLAPAAEDRHASMDELVTVLERDPDATRKRLLFVAAPAVIAAAAVILSLRATAPGPVCAGGEERLAGVWDTATRTRVRAAFTATRLPFAEDSFGRLADELDRRAASWLAMRREACVATNVRHEQSAAMLDLRMSCLDRRRGELGALTALLGGSGDTGVLLRALPAAQRLPSVTFCADTAALSAEVSPPADPGLRLAVAALRARVTQARARAELMVGVWAPEGQGLVAEARALGDASVLADALRTLAIMQRTADRDHALASFDAALLEAAHARDDQIAAALYADELWFLAAVQGRFADARLLLAPAIAAVARAGNPPALRAELLATSAIIFGNLGELGRAREQVEAALAIAAGIDERDYMVASLHNDYAIWLRKEGRLPEAMRAAERAVALVERHLGPDAPQLTIMLNTLSSVAIDAGDYARSEQTCRRALAVAERVYGPEHQQVGRILDNLGNALQMLGDHKGAETVELRAAALQEKLLGPEHTELGTTFTMLSGSRISLGDLDGARAAAGRALAIHEKAGDARVGWDQLYLAQLDRLEGQLDRARERGAAALDGFIKSRGPESPAVQASHVELARIELAAGRLDAAAEHARRVVELRSKPGGNVRDQAAAIDLDAEILAARGRHADALARHEASLAMLSRVVGPDDHELARPLLGIGLAQLALGHAADAVPPLERAVALRGETRGGPLEVSRCRFALARALWDASRDRPRARELAGQATGLLGPPRKETAKDRAELAAWLRARGG